MLLIFERLEETGKGTNRKIYDPISPGIGSNSESSGKFPNAKIPLNGRWGVFLSHPALR